MYTSRLLTVDSICDEKDYFLYIQKNVIVVLKDANMKTGKVLDVGDGMIVLDSGELVEYESIQNLFFYGTITNYGKKRREGTIDNTVSFLKDDNVEENILPYIFYDEYKCVVAGHLYKNSDDMRHYYAKDLVIIKAEATADYSGLMGIRVQVSLKDGECLYGRVIGIDDEKLQIIADRKSVEIDRKDIDDIQKAVDFHDEVCVTTWDDEKVCGKVENVSDSKGTLLLEEGEEFKFEDIKELEYISHNVRIGQADDGYLDEKYYFYHGNFVDERFDFRADEFRGVLEKVNLNSSDVTVYFKIGISDKGLIAKSMHTDSVKKQEIDNDTKIGIVVHFDTKSAHIGTSYEECGIENIGKTVFFPKHMPMDFDYNYEYIYIVEYKPFGITQDSKKNVYEATDRRYGIRLVEKFLRGVYKKIQIVDGQIEKIPFEKQEYMTGYIENLLGQKGVIRGADNECYEFSTESILNKQPIMLVKNRYEVEFFPNVSAYATVARRARAITITNVKSLYKETVSTEAKTESKETLSLADKKKLYKAFQEHFGVNQWYLMTQVSVVMNECGYTKEKYGPHIELLTSMSDFVQIYRESKTIVKVSFRPNNKYAELGVNTSVQAEEELPLEMEDENSPYVYGLINLCFGTNYALIYSKYINKFYMSEMQEADVEKPLQFFPQEAKIDFKMYTNKYAYLVKYVPGGTTINARTGGEIQTIDYEYPVILVKKISKKQYSRLELRGNKLILTPALKQIESSQPVNDEEELEIADSYLNFVNGENYFQLCKDGSISFKLHQQDGNGDVTSEAKKSADESIERIFRIGVVTGCDFSKQVGMINGMIPFDMAVVESKTLNILKANKGCERGTIHVIYCCEKKQVVEIQRIPASYLELLSWEDGRVIDCEYNKKQVVLEQNVIHYLSVSSDAWVCKLFGQKELKNQNVYIKSASHPMLTEQGVELFTTAVDVHCKEEVATLKYDLIKNLFLAYRNPTFFYPIVGEEKELLSLEGQQITVHFVVNEKGTGLLAMTEEGNIGEIEPEEEKVEETIGQNKIENSVLAQYQLEQVTISQLRLPPDILLGEDGFPYGEEARKAVRWLCGGKEFKRYIAAACIMFTADIPDVTIKGKVLRTVRPRKLILEAFFRHVESIIADPNGIYGEYSYYIATMLNCSNLNKEKLSYYLFAQDFINRYDMPEMIRGEQFSFEQLEGLFAGECQNIDELLSHLFLLDENSFAKMKELIQKNEVMSERIKKYICENFAEQIGTSGTEDVTCGDLCSRLRVLFAGERRRLVQVLNNEKDIFESVRIGMALARNFFLKLVCKDDKQRFTELEECIAKYYEGLNEAEFSRKEDCLNEMLRRCNALSEEITAHPTKEAMEILVIETRILEKLMEAVRKELDILYKNAIPHIVCTANEYNVSRDITSIFLIFENTSKNISQVVNLQSANHLKLEMQSATYGLQVGNSPELSSISIRCNDKVTAEVKVDLSGLDEETADFTIMYNLSYDYFGGYDMIETGQAEGEITLQIMPKDEVEIDKNKENPYAGPASGDALSDAKMFYGRSREMGEIWDYLVDGDHFVPGKAIIIYGQKKCGKTSLLNQLGLRIKNDQCLNENTIIIPFADMLVENTSSDNLDNFNLTFYHNILQRFRRVIRRSHPDVVEMLEENGLEIPDVARDQNIAASLFFNFFEEFNELDEGKHSILITMDEFTRFCSAVRMKKEYYALPNFIKAFSKLGFVQILIGHDSMMRTLGYLGVLNATAEFAKQFELSALEEEEARKLIKEPMKTTFGVDVYDTPLGEIAVEKLIELSGCSPCYLMRLCDQVFDYYVSIKRIYLNGYDISNVMMEYIDKLQSDNFDILLVEDGDGVDNMEDRNSFKYLKTIALESKDAVNKDCSADILCEELDDNVNVEVQGLLESRRVIRIRNGRVKIIVGLFREYILRKFVR